ncbi:MAG TPA: cytochrome P450 [Pseudomonadales bacterium]|nr:cytochrome P450 [Pseudomonadales bacterium]
MSANPSSLHTPDYAITDYMRQPDNQDLRGIPGDMGLPVIGHNIGFIKDTFAFADRAYKLYGPLSTMNSFGLKGVLALGPDLAQQIFLDPGRDFSSKMGFQDRVGRFMNDSLAMLDFEHHRHQRRLMQSAFKNEAMQLYTDRINFIYRRALAEWSQESEIPFFDHMKNLLLEVAADIFVGVQERGPQMQKLNQAFLDVVAGLMFIRPINLPGFVYHKGLKGKEVLRSFIRSLIPSRRSGDGIDVLSYFCKEKNELGESFTEDEIIGQMAFLLFAAHDTTTAALTHTIYYLVRHPEIKQRLYEECLAMGTDELRYDQLDAAPYMGHVFNETQRIRPSVPLLPRRTVREVEMAGYKVPAHTQVFIFSRYSHYMPEYWSNPFTFDPDRFERGEHKKHPFQFHPFGGGAHKCIGMHFSQMEYKCFLHQFMLKFDFKRTSNNDPWMQTLPLPKPSDNMPIKLFPRR